MHRIVIYCKSYRNDVLRVRRLAQSIQEFNRERLPFFVSVPSADLPLFREQLAGHMVEFIADEQIIRANPGLDMDKVLALPGGISQQIVKSEFWRLGLCETFVCIDSDCQFIRSFGAPDFLAPEGHPYTVMHEAKELLQFAVNNNLEKIYECFHQEHRILMDRFDRAGRAFDFGPAPMIWSSLVWKALDERFLKPRQMNFTDAILMFPAEIQWYGEAMLKFRPFPLMPVEPLFKIYHYEYQYAAGRRAGDTLERLARNFLGVCYQSNWNKEADFLADPKPLLSRGWRAFRRKVFRRRT